MTLRNYDVLGRKEDVKAVLSLIQRDSPYFKRDRAEPDFYIVVGGDGVITYGRDREKLISGKPVLRVRYRSKNGPTGKKSLGFTADVALNDLGKALDDIVESRYSTDEKAYLLDCFIDSEKKGTAIYDLVVETSAKFSSMLFKAVVHQKNGREQKLTNPQCDKILVSTKYGSPAWGLSAGGAINVSADNCLQVFYVEASIVQSKYLITTDDVLQLEILRKAAIGFDGRSKLCRADTGSTLSITGSKDYIKLLRTDNTYEDILSKIKRQQEFMLNSVA